MLFETHCYKKYFDGIDDLILNVKSNALDTSIQVKGIKISCDFRPELTGKKTRKLLKQ